MSKPRIKLANKACWKCAYCGQGMRPEMGFQNSATVEHVIPRSQGGTDTQDNLISACARCNRLRGVQDVNQFKLIAQFLCGDRRSIEQADQDAKRLRKKELRSMCVDVEFTYLAIPEHQLRSKEKLRRDRTLVKRALKQYDQNPFELGTRCHRLFDKEQQRVRAPGHTQVDMIMVEPISCTTQMEIL